MTTPKAPKRQTAASGGFARAVLVLVSGTALAHGLTAAALPVLSRLYTPTDFGLLAVFSSVLSIAAVAACLRYDVAVAIPERDDDALHLVALALSCSIGVAALLATAVAIAPGWIAKCLGQPALASMLWLVPVGVLLAGAYSALQFWYIRQKRFTLLARTRIVQSASSAGTQIGLGWWAAIGPFGLLLGYVMNTGTACVSLGWQLLRKAPPISWSRMCELAAEYSRFPKYSTFEALANSAAIQLPIIMIAALAAPAEAGYLMIAMTVMQAPMSLIGTAIGQVYLSRAPAEHRRGQLGRFTVDTLNGLFKAGAGPMLAAGILSPVLFGHIFGADWHRAGWLVFWMTPWFLLQFLAVPIALGLHVTGNLRAALQLQAGGLVLRIAMVWAASKWQVSLISEAYAISGAIFYLCYLIVILAAVGVSWRSVALGLRFGAGITLAWALGAASIAFCIHLLAPGSA